MVDPNTPASSQLVMHFGPLIKAGAGTQRRLGGNGAFRSWTEAIAEKYAAIRTAIEAASSRSENENSVQKPAATYGPVGFFMGKLARGHRFSR